MTNKQTKLKVGDRVRVIKTDIQPQKEFIGTEATIKRIEYTIYFLDINTIYGFYESEIQLIPNTKSKWKYSRKEAIELARVRGYGFKSLEKLLLEKQIKPVERVLNEKPSTGKHLDKLVVPDKIEEDFSCEGFEIEKMFKDKINEIIDYLISLQKEK
jgi:hypothetical protein